MKDDYCPGDGKRPASAMSSNQLQTCPGSPGSSMAWPHHGMAKLQALDSFSPAQQCLLHLQEFQVTLILVQDITDDLLLGAAHDVVSLG